MIKKINLLLLFTMAAFTLQAQKPVLRSLHTNARIIEYRKNLPVHTQLNNRTQSTSSVSLTLPFYDDFSYPGPYPDTTKWQNSQSVFINRTKAIAPPTLGVATFDGLNKYGYPYNSAVTSGQGNQTSEASDTLMSMPIRLDSSGNTGFSPADSIYLSFYYEGRGYWDKPETGDELRLDFYNPTDTVWDPIWSHGGYTYDPDSTWHIVMIPITDPTYFKKDFRFRFTNLSSGSGDVDHWHIDVVYINNIRNNKDTIFGDFTFAYDLSSPLKNYSQMPFRQYSGLADMKSNIHAYLRNNFDDASHENVSTYYSFYNKIGSSLYSKYNGNFNLGYYYNVGYCTDTTIIYPSLNGFSYPLMNATDSFTMKFYLQQTSQNPGLYENDTICFHQVFSNYYAYDDGSAENGVTIGTSIGNGSYKAAVRYTLNTMDTLGAMDIFFDPISDVDLIKAAPFNILVWSDNAGLPGSIIYTDSMHFPYFPADTVVQGVEPRENNYLRYQFKTPLILGAGTTFYLGINQIYPAPELTIGFDMNTDFHRNMFYNSDGTNWYVFPGDLDPDYRGSLMIRPVFGNASETTSIKEYAGKSTGFKLYPNPASDYVSLQSTDVISNIVITDLLGNTILQQTGTGIKAINTLSLPAGIYLLKAFTDKGFADTQKLIIAK